MSIYGEGAYQSVAGQVVYPGLRSPARLTRREWECYHPADDTVLTPRPTAEDKPLAPNTIYAISKRDQEEMCLAVGRAYRLPTVALRFFNIYGEGQALSNPYTGVAAIFGSRSTLNPSVFCLTMKTLTCRPSIPTASLRATTKM